MKKMLCVLLTLSLLICTTALAEGTYDETDNTASTTLTTTIADPTQPAPTYTIIIPATLDIAPNAASTPLMIKLVEVQNASEIKVTAAATNGSMRNSSGGAINFTVQSGTLTYSNFSSLPSEKQMSIEITSEQWQQAEAGTYTGEMTFTISATPAE